jgi:hypothetical protein
MTKVSCTLDVRAPHSEFVIRIYFGFRHSWYAISAKCGRTMDF